jgi:anaerobic C4-dicarboxylate transporter DcuA
VVIFLLEVLIMIFLVVFGLRKGGAIGCGVFGVLGVLLMVFVFKLPPGSPPMAAILIILSIGIAGGTLQATGGIDYLVLLAAKIIRRFPKSITFIAPAIVFLFVFGIGTANIALSLEPIIAETAVKAKIRPERPLVSAVLTANLALLCSPAASSTAYVVSVLAVTGLTMGNYLSIVLPAALIGMLALSVFMSIKGRRLIKDKEFMERFEHLHNAEVQADPVFSTKTKLSVVVFLIGVLGILTLGIFPDLAPTFMVDGEVLKLKTTDVVQVFMYSSAAINMVLMKVTPKQVFGANITSSAIGAALAVLGPGWLGGTIFNSPDNMALLKGTVGGIITQFPWLIILVIMFVAILVMAQTAVASIVFPLALSLGVPPAFLAGIVQTLNVNFVIPAQPTLLFAVDLDKTGSTKKTRFIVPGFFVTAVTIIAGVCISTFILGW